MEYLGKYIFLASKSYFFHNGLFIAFKKNHSSFLTNGKKEKVFLEMYNYDGNDWYYRFCFYCYYGTSKYRIILIFLSPKRDKNVLLNEISFEAVVPFSDFLWP